MPLNVYGQRTVAEFQAAIEPWMVGYEHNSFTYVAVPPGMWLGFVARSPAT
jgi:hypothetical protein